MMVLLKFWAGAETSAFMMDVFNFIAGLALRSDMEVANVLSWEQVSGRAAKQSTCKLREQIGQASQCTRSER